MNIEIVGFYPCESKKRRIIGTMHAYLVDHKIDIRGIMVKKMAKDSYFYHMPGKSVFDDEDQEWVWFPFFTFTDTDTHQDMMQSFILKANEYLKKELTKGGDKS